MKAQDYKKHACEQRKSESLLVLGQNPLLASVELNVMRLAPQSVFAKVSELHSQ